MLKSGSFLLVILLLITAAMLFVTQNRTIDKSSGEVQSEGKPLIGGDFTLINQDDKEVSNKDLHGKVMMVFFGFTYCPDICPVTVATFAKVLEILGDKAGGVAPVFITIDPERDTPEVLKNYLANIDERIIGLTGSKEQVKNAASQYKAYFAKAKTATEKAEEDMTGSTDYIMDHSGFIYVMDKSGSYVQHFPYDADAEEIAAAVSSLLK